MISLWAGEWALQQAPSTSPYRASSATLHGGAQGSEWLTSVEKNRSQQNWHHQSFSRAAEQMSQLPEVCFLTPRTIYLSMSSMFAHSCCCLKPSFWTSSHLPGCNAKSIPSVLPTYQVTALRMSYKRVGSLGPPSAGLPARVLGCS